MKGLGRVGALIRFARDHYFFHQSTTTDRANCIVPMPDSKPSAPLSGVVDDPANIPSPKLGVPSTGNLVTDSFRVRDTATILVTLTRSCASKECSSHWRSPLCAQQPSRRNRKRRRHRFYTRSVCACVLTCSFSHCQARLTRRSAPVVAGSWAVFTWALVSATSL
jgi:hypothetical protein